MNKNFDIIIFTLFRTDHEYSSVSLSWAKEISKNNRVFYLNHPYSLKDFFQGLGSPSIKKQLPYLLTNRISYEKNEQIPENFISIRPTLSLPINWLPPGKIYNFFSNLNNKIVLRAIRKAIKDFNIEKFIYLNCYDPYFAGFLPNDFGATLSIYQSIDDISQDPYSKKHGEKLEAKAIANSDLALVTSTQLQNILIQHNPNTFIAHNAVDISIFEKTLQEEFPKPLEIEQVTGKIIGFTGNLDYLRIDYPLLKKIAEHHSDKTLLLVGPINSDEFYEVGLDKLPNVIFTGGKNIQQLPHYLQYMDCSIIPFKCNTLTESIYPLKVNEYLAAGRPVISTAFSDDIRTFRDVVYLADSEAEFLQFIDQAIAENSNDKIEKRVLIANENTWEARVSQFWQIVKNFLSDQKDKRNRKQFDLNPREQWIEFFGLIIISVLLLGFFLKIVFF